MSKKFPTALPFLPKQKTLSSLRRAAETCKGCPLYKNATQTVFGEGGKSAKLMIVGEIPGNKEDITGRPFTGPAGILLRQSLETSGLDEDEIYFTNVVKHFKFSFLNNKRMHRSPSGLEIKACRPWLDAEVSVIQPKIIICLGATAAKSLVDKKFAVQKERGKWFKPKEGLQILVTFHPSAILRAPNDATRHTMKAFFIRDLKKVRLVLKKIKGFY